MQKRILCGLFLFLTLFLLTSCVRFNLEITGENEVNVGETIKLEHNYTGKSKAIWSSLDNRIASVDENGVVTGINPGKVGIRVYVEKYSYTFDVEVIKTEFNVFIAGRTRIELGKWETFEASVDGQVINDVLWESSNQEVGVISSSGIFTSKAIGSTTISATYKGNVASIEVVVVENKIPYIRLTGPTRLKIGEEGKISVGVGNNDGSVPVGELRYSYDPKGIVSVTGAPYYGNLQVRGLSVGKVEVKVYFSKRPDIYDILEIEIIEEEPNTIEITTDDNFTSGEINKLSYLVNGKESNLEVIWQSNHEDVLMIYEDNILALKPGVATITGYLKDYPNVFVSKDIVVNKYESTKYSEEDYQRIKSILDNMTLEQKVGQMFAIGFSGTSYSNTLDNVIKNYHFGNVIYMGANVTNPSTLALMSNEIQNAMIQSNGVPAFITIDQEGGRVVRLTNGGTHFISNMAMGATGDFNNTYLEGIAIGKELRNYGINVDFAPVLDVNNNPANPVIGVRSYGENPFLVASYGVGMIKGLSTSKVMATSKHFPGHGNTSVDSHSGLPVITSSKEDLYKIELAPFIASMYAGIDAIMTTHIIFTEIDKDLPATISSKVLTDLLRNELGYDGLIITDGMEMGALKNSFGSNEELAVKAVKAGVDILLYTSNTTPRNAHSAIINAVNNGEISIDRINDSVERILLKKLKYGILDEYLAPNNNINSLLEENENLNNKFAMESLTLLNGEFNGLDKTKKTLIISPTCKYQIDAKLTDNSLGAYASNYLKQNGFETCDFETISSSPSSTSISNLINKLDSYDQVIIALSNVNDSGLIKLVNTACNKKSNTLVIALDSPYDYIKYDDIKTYICVYGYQKASVIAITKYLNGEYIATGVSPIEYRK